jgi:hypothetical protein
MKHHLSLISTYKLTSPLSWLLVLAAITFLSSCNQQSIGFALPPGNAEDGKIVFEKMACNQCHSVGTIPWQGISSEDFQVKLGGEVIHVKTYGELVTSIINPTHRISTKLQESTIPNRNAQSPMPSYNQVMTVQELIDLVTFLQGEYDLVPPAGFYSPL